MKTLSVVVPGLMLLAAGAAQAAQSSERNIDESKVGTYTLPEMLLTQDGRRVVEPSLWRSVRRGELVAGFADSTYGRTPVLTVKQRPTIVATKRNAVEGLATRTLVEIRFFAEPAAPKMTLMLYVPNAARGPAPVLLGLNYYGLASVEADPALPLTDQWMRPTKEMGIVKNRATEATRGSHASRWPLALALKRGYAVATYYYGDLEPDHPDGWIEGLRGYLMRREGRATRGPDEWGAIGVWAWGLSRARARDAAGHRRAPDHRLRAFAPRQDGAMGRGAGRKLCGGHLQ